MCSGISTAALLHTIAYKVLFPPQINGKGYSQNSACADLGGQGVHQDIPQGL